MRSFTVKKLLWICVAVFTVAYLPIVVSAQQIQKPLLQEPRAEGQGPQSSVNQTDLVRKTSDVSPVLADVGIPGASGVLVETLDGKPVIDAYSDAAFNPASNVKVATAYAVLKVFGPDYRFLTNVWTDGTLDRSTGTLNGNLYVSGRDPIFGFAHAVAIAAELNKLGIRSITGGLVVSDNFTINQSNSVSASASSLLGALVAETRSAVAARAWDNHLLHTARLGETLFPGVTFGAGASVNALPAGARMLFSHESAPLRDILKVNLSYSNNFLSERLGQMVGGPFAVARLVHQGVGVPAEEFSLQTASGLGVNRVTPRAMMKLLRVLREDLTRMNMSFADIMPVAGIDNGTLVGRFNDRTVRGSVIGKTGTLGQTDAGVSSLAGEVYTKQGPVLFVIFNQRGSVARFRNFQNYYVNLILNQFGGASPIAYSGADLETRLARTRISYPENSGE
jgi:D-alanyl-D-alanine carboxypeptidase/D-alanyl-D-alanine-endopeptidase (penicillin-binding protein 4)